MDQQGTSRAEPPATGRPFLQLTFRCANAYLRVYRSADGAQYLGRCPRCGESVRFVVGEGGTGQRSFVVDCNR